MPHPLATYDIKAAPSLAPTTLEPPMNPEEFARKVGNRIDHLLPKGLSDTKKDLQNNIKSIISESLTKLDVVSREDFEIQQAVLLKTRSKLEALEQRLQQLEDQLQSKS